MEEVCLCSLKVLHHLQFALFLVVSVAEDVSPQLLLPVVAPATCHHDGLFNPSETMSPNQLSLLHVSSVTVFDHSKGEVMRLLELASAPTGRPPL